MARIPVNGKPSGGIEICLTSKPFQPVGCSTCPFQPAHLDTGPAPSNSCSPYLTPPRTQNRLWLGGLLHCLLAVPALPGPSYLEIRGWGLVPRRRKT